MSDEELEEDFDSPRECMYCHHVFDSAVYFETAPFRVFCPSCGNYQPKENDYSYYLEY